VLLACAPHSVDTVRKGRARRAKLDFNVLNDAKLKIRKLAESAGIDFKPTRSGYPHFYYIDDKVKGRDTAVFDLSGGRIRQILDDVASSDLSALKKGESRATTIATPKGIVKGALVNADDQNYQLIVPVKKAAQVATWLRDLSDGYTSFKLDGEKDFSAKRMPAPFSVSQAKKARVKKAWPVTGEAVSEDKPYFIGISSEARAEPSQRVKKEAKPSEVEPAIHQAEKLYDVHKSSGTDGPFADWEMPVQYRGFSGAPGRAMRRACSMFRTWGCTMCAARTRRRSSIRSVVMTAAG
jgi:glycine hydroxymethyltransferase